MRKRHNTLNDNIFRNSKYINIVNRITNSDFRKEYKEQYDFMLDTFSTLIYLNNCFFSDSNLGLKDKIENAITIIATINKVLNENTFLAIFFTVSFFIFFKKSPPLLINIDINIIPINLFIFNNNSI